MAMGSNTVALLNYLKENVDRDITAAQAAEELGLTQRQVDGGFTSGLQKKDLGYREEAEIELNDGTHKKVKFLRLTDLGLTFDPNAPTE